MKQKLMNHSLNLLEALMEQVKHFCVRGLENMH